MAGTTTAYNTTTFTTTPPSLSTAPTNSTATNTDESMKLAIAFALLRSKLLSQPPQQPQHHSQPHSLSSSSSLRWRLKAKDRKKEVIRLKDELKHLEDDLRGDLYPKSASCKCYFFDDLRGLSVKQVKFGVDHRFTDVLRRRFLRQVRLQKRFKKSKSDSIEQRSFSEVYKEDDTELLKLSADFLVDICEASNPVETPHYASLTHQAVDFILGSLNHGLSAGKDATVIEGIISSLIVRLVKRMCTPMEDELYCDLETDVQSHVQHIICQVGRVAYVGQRVMLAVCHRISEQVEILRPLDAFDESFALIHDSIYVIYKLTLVYMVRKVEVDIDRPSKSNVYNLIGMKGVHCIGLFEEWASSFLQARKALQSMEQRSGIYAIYMDRVTGELARQVGQISYHQKLNQDIIDSLFT